MKRFAGIVAGTTIAIALFSPAGCPQQQIGGGTTTIDPSALTDLTDTELGALNDLLTSPAGLALAAAVLSSGPGSDATLQSSLGAGDSFGTCPVVSFSATQGNALTLGLSIDFGTGCTPTGTSSVCSGEAAGTYAVVSSTISASFADVGCDEYTLTGDTTVTFAVDTQGIELGGDWNLGFAHGTNETSTAGVGSAIFDSANQRTSIPSFVGTLTDASNNTFDASLDDIELSYENYTNFVPYAGEATVSSNDIRPITVRFNADSPVTGAIEISVDGSPFFDANLNNL